MRKDKYFFTINLLLLIFVIVGFAPTFYLRPIGSLEPLPFDMILHGTICTAWFFAVVLQSYLIMKNKIVYHKKFGMYFSFIAPALVISGFIVVYTLMMSSLAKSPSLFDESMAEKAKFGAIFYAGNYLMLVMYAIYFYLGYHFRYKPNYHKRFMLFASTLITGQAAVRIIRIEMLQFGQDGNISGFIYSTLPITIIISLLIYDLFKLKKPHWATIIGIIGIVFLVLMVSVIGLSGVGVEWMEMIRLSLH